MLALNSLKCDRILPTRLQQALEQGNYSGALELVESNEEGGALLHHLDEVVSMVLEKLTEDYEKSNPELFDCCRKLLDILLEMCKPEDILITFIEEIEEAKDDVKFVLLLKHLNRFIFAQAKTNSVNLCGWCFQAIVTYLGNISPQDDSILLEGERLLLDNSEFVQRLLSLYDHIFQLLDGLMEELLKLNLKITREMNLMTCQFIILLLDKPLAFLPMDLLKDSKPIARRIAEKLVAKAFNINIDLVVYLELPNNNFNIVTDLSLGSFFYLVFAESVCLSSVPKVYSQVYIFQNCLKFCSALLIEGNLFVIEKGLKLACALLPNIDVLELSYELLDSEVHSKFCKALCFIIVHNNVNSYRTLGLNILHSYLWAFDHAGRYLVIQNLLKIVSHSGLKGNIITQYKEMLRLEEQTATSKNQYELGPYYSGDKLINHLQLFTFLKEQEKTDLVNESDQIIATLNLLRYILQDIFFSKYMDWYWNILEQTYFKYLRVGIEMAKVHYSYEIKQIKDGTASKPYSACKESLSVAGTQLPELPDGDKIKILNLSLTALDLIASLLSRLQECYSMRSARSSLQE